MRIQTPAHLNPLSASSESPGNPCFSSTGGWPLHCNQSACPSTGFQSQYLHTWVSPDSITFSQKGESIIQCHKSVTKLHLQLNNCTCWPYKGDHPVGHVESWILLPELGDISQGIQRPKPRTLYLHQITEIVTLCYWGGCGKEDHKWSLGNSRVHQILVGHMLSTGAHRGKQVLFLPSV